MCVTASLGSRFLAVFNFYYAHCSLKATCGLPLATPDAAFFAQYADVIHPSEDDLWSFNEVYSFFFSIYQIYNDVTFIRSLYF